jgi:transposase
MATPRKQFARSLGQNRPRNYQLNPFERHAIVQDCLNSVPHTVLAARYSCHRNTIRTTFNRWKDQQNFESRPVTGRPRRLTPRERRLLFRYIRKDPTRTWSNLLYYCKESLGKTVSKNTIRQAFRTLKLSHWRSLKRIFLSKKAILDRGKFWRFWRGREADLTEVYL